MITGAGGSIGSELVRQCLTFDPDLLILLDQSEHNLFHIEKELSKIFSTSLSSDNSDIRDKGLLERVFSSFLPDVVFHALRTNMSPCKKITLGKLSKLIFKALSILLM